MKTETSATSEKRPHIPVMLSEVLQTLSPTDNETYIDGTFGAGGYTSAILDNAKCNVIAIDRDPNVKNTVADFEKKYGKRFSFINGCFGDMDMLLSQTDKKAVDGVVLDIGVSSMQIDEAERGFSFRFNGPLDMRMSRDGDDAQTFINTAHEETIANVIYKYGEERLSRRIAKAIVERRAEKAITTTLELADIVRSVYPKTYHKIDPATRTFQALRIHINDELGELERGLEAAEKILVPGGRLVVVTFHSLEDSIVKDFLKKRSDAKEHVNKYRANEEQSDASFKLVERKALQATALESKQNPRSRSAKLRVALRTDKPAYREAA